MAGSGRHEIPHELFCEVNPACMKSFEEVERRISRLEEDPWKKELTQGLTEVKEAIANLNGRLVGYLAAAGILGAGLLFVAQRVLK